MFFTNQFPLFFLLFSPPPAPPHRLLLLHAHVHYCAGRSRAAQLPPRAWWSPAALGPLFSAATDQVEASAAAAAVPDESSSMRTWTIREMKSGHPCAGIPSFVPHFTELSPPAQHSRSGPLLPTRLPSHQLFPNESQKETSVTMREGCRYVGRRVQG